MGSVRIVAGITVENMLIVFQEIATECKYTHMRLSSYVGYSLMHSRTRFNFL